MITERDRKIINFIDSVNYASISNIASLFFSESKFSYDLARKRLNKIKNMGEYIKSIQNLETNELIYIPYNSNRKRVSIHDITVINYACKLYELGCEVKEIIIQPIFGNIIPDAYIRFVYDDYQYQQLVEVQIRHNKPDFEKYKSVDVMNKILEKTEETIPTLVLIQDTNIKYEDDELNMDIVQIQTNLRDASKALTLNIQ